MTYDKMERELQHLEYVMGHITAADTVPTLDYWRSRLHSLRQESTEPAQRERLHRLEQLLCSLEYSVQNRMEVAVSRRFAHSASRSRR